MSLTEHMLPTAMAAEQDDAEPILLASALLHHYGHWVHELPDDAAEYGLDTEHEEAGAAWLERHFVRDSAPHVRTIHQFDIPCPQLASYHTNRKQVKTRRRRIRIEKRNAHSASLAVGSHERLPTTGGELVKR